MTNQEINETIADIMGVDHDSKCKICGNLYRHPSHILHGADIENSCKHYFSEKETPDYCGNMNLMSEVEKSIQPKDNTEKELSLWSKYEQELRKITLENGREGGGLYERLILATATERAIAFLKANGKYRE